MKYGREDADWDALITAGRRFLEERAKLQKTTSYTELNTVLHQRTRLRSFDFSRNDERAAMGHLVSW